MTVWKPNYRPSNGTGGDYFDTGPMGCRSCTIDHDLGWHEPAPDGGDSCPILMTALISDGGPGPDEWEHTEYTDHGFDTRCTAWKGPCACTEGTTYQPPTGVYLEGLISGVEQP